MVAKLWETIMNMNDVKVNETHMCVLRKVKNKMKVDFVELKNRYQDQLDALKCMVDNDKCSVLDLQDFVKGSSLKKLLQNFNYCSCLSDSYQGIPCLPSISFIDYQSKINEYDKKNDVCGKESYAREERHKYYNCILDRIQPAMIEDLSNDLRNDSSIMAYSHRRVGWARTTFNLNDDIRVVYLTNFGYGRASYFFLLLYYKGIGILPYSYWIHYRIVNTFQIIRYTRIYQLDNKEWMEAMSFTANTYNDAVDNPDSFVQKYILSEVEEMVSGLEMIRNSKKYNVLVSFFNSHYIILEGDNLIRFKGEKISGALDFLDQLQTLTPITDKVGKYIQRIISSNISIVPELQKTLPNKKKTLKSILEKIANEQPIWDELDSRNEQYEQMRNEMYDAIAEEDAFVEENWGTITHELDIRFGKEHPEYDTFKKEYKAEYDVYHNLCSKHKETQSFIEEIQKYLDKIKAYKDYMVKNKIVA